jgi:FHA domain
MAATPRVHHQEVDGVTADVQYAQSHAVQLNGSTLDFCARRTSSQWMVSVDPKPYTVSITRGDGLIGRFGDAVIYTGDDSSTAARMLAAVEATADSEHPGPAIAERLADITFGAEQVRTPFGLVAPCADGLLLLLRGAVTAAFDDGRTLSGDRALTWVDEVLPESVQRVAVTGGSGGDASPRPHTDLRAGVAPGGGFVLSRESAQPRRTESVASESKPTEEPTLAWSTVETVTGALVSTDGVVYPLDRDYVIGRDPQRDDSVRNSTASAIVLGTDQHISRVHAYVSIQGTAVLVRDASTPGGTFIANPGAADWTRIGTTPTELEPGCSLRVGDQILIYHTEG